MSMRVIECNLCGEPLAAATDEELLRRVRAHLESEHAAEHEYDEDQARAMIAEQAYTASDN
jgi:predicted small metal-binding protein